MKNLWESADQLDMEEFINEQNAEIMISMADPE